MTQRPTATACSARPPIPAGDPLPPEDRASEPAIANVIEPLFREQSSRLLRFFSRRGGRQDAGDLMQESFFRMARLGEPRLAALDEPAAYLGQVAKNLLKNRARAAYHRTVAMGEAAGRQTGIGDLTVEVEARDQLRRLELSLSKLSPQTREIFLAHRVEGASYAEIAARVGLTVKGVEWHMAKAIKHIHRLLDRS